jgi:hypothetical protein
MTFTCGRTALALPHVGDVEREQFADAKAHVEPKRHERLIPRGKFREDGVNKWEFVFEESFASRHAPRWRGLKLAPGTSPLSG